jgi:Holliday junction resolvasome RuvABC ATP-dependent DNA helicase subunit
LLEIYLGSAKRGGHLPHILLIGGSRENSAAVANLIARQLNLSFQEISSERAVKLGQLAATFIGMERAGILFVSDLDNFTQGAEKTLRNAMEESYVPIKIEEWGVIRDEEIQLLSFTVIGSISNNPKVVTSWNKRFPIQLYLAH